MPLPIGVCMLRMQCHAQISTSYLGVKNQSFSFEQNSVVMLLWHPLRLLSLCSRVFYTLVLGRGDPEENLKL